MPAEVVRGRRLRRPEVLPPLNMAPVNEEMNEFLSKRMSSQRTLQIAEFNWNEIRPDALEPGVLDYVDYLRNVEVGSPSYIRKHMESALAGGAAWKVNWLNHPDGWGRQETMHGELLAEYTIRAGRISREAMERKKQEVRSRPFTIGEGYNPLESDLYSAMQESLTAPSYEIIYEASKPDPVLHGIIKGIGTQEYFHSAVFFKGVEIGVKHNTGRKEDVVRAIGAFKMPSHEIVSKEDLKSALQSAKKYNFPRRVVLTRMAAQFTKILGNEKAGKAARLYIKNNEVGTLTKIATFVSRPILSDKKFAQAANIFIRKVLPRTV